MAFGTMLLGTLLAAAALRRGLVLISELLRGGGAPRFPGTTGSAPVFRLNTGSSPSVPAVLGAVLGAVFGRSGNAAVETASKVEGDIRLVPRAGMLPPRGTWLRAARTAATASGESSFCLDCSSAAITDFVEAALGVA